MNILKFFKLINEESKVYSPLYGTITFKCIRPFNPLDKNTVKIIECQTSPGNTVLFTHEGKPIIYHPSGEMIYETNMGECMLFLSKRYQDWEVIFRALGINKETED